VASKITWSWGAEPTKYPTALRAMRTRTVMTKREWEGLSGRARSNGFALAQVAQVGVIEKVNQSLQKVIDGSQTFDEWKKEIGPELLSAWGGNVKDPGARLRNIFRTEVQRAYNHARVAQLQDPDVADVFGDWQYSAIKDGRTSKLCRKCHGVLLPKDDPWWATHIPPLHCQCRSTVKPVRTGKAKRTEAPPSELPKDGFGLEPDIRDPIPETLARVERSREQVRTADIPPQAKPAAARKVAQVPPPKVNEDSSAFQRGAALGKGEPDEVAWPLGHGKACLVRGQKRPDAVNLQVVDTLSAGLAKLKSAPAPMRAAAAEQTLTITPQKVQVPTRKPQGRVVEVFLSALTDASVKVPRLPTGAKWNTTADLLRLYADELEKLPRFAAVKRQRPGFDLGRALVSWLTGDSAAWAGSQDDLLLALGLLAGA
jgi:SPP1 gp7 family putative phage head morphogenesis protein